MPMALRLAEAPDGMRDGAFTALVIVSGQGNDPRNDANVSIAFFNSRDKMVKDANGDIARDYSFRINPDPRYQSVVKARTRNGVLESVGPSEVIMHDAETAPFFPLKLDLLRAQCRFEQKADGTMEGFVGGYRSIEDYYMGWAAGGAIHELTTHGNMPAYWYALRRYADAMPDPVTMILRSGRVAFRLAITSNRFCPERLPSRMRSMPCSVLISGSPAEISSNSGSESNNARNPTNRNGSLSTTAIRITGFLATAAFISFPCGPQVFYSA